MPPRDAPLAAVLKRDRVIVLLCLAAITLLAWAYVLWLAAAMQAPSPDMPAMNMVEMTAMVSPGFVAWTFEHFLFMFVMWAIMMVGMMTPSVAPMILLYAQVGRQAAARGRPFAPAAWFAAGYLAAWTLFSLLATAGQWALDQAALLTPMMASASAMFGGVLLIAAGVYQWTPLKDACLASCRAPLAFVQQHGGFQSRRSGSLRLGLLHGAYCVGCCWALMALLFLGGVMNILWIAGLMIFVLMEKIIPGGRFLARLAGACAVAAGVWMIATV